METNYKNIPATGFSAVKSEKTMSTVVVQMNLTGTITLSAFSIFQLLAGLQHIKIHSTEIIRTFFKEHAYDTLAVAGKLYSLAMAPRQDSEGEIHQVDVLRSEVEIMFELLKIRMKHCEQQRDERNPAFNSDTYIGQKILLLEMKEWLSLEAIEAAARPAEKKVQQTVES